MTITIVGGGNPSGPTYPLQRSVRIRGSASAYFNRTPAVASNRQTWTWSGWVKRGVIIPGAQTFFCNGSAAGTNITQLLFSTDTLSLQVYDTNTIAQLVSTAVYRDPSAWYHIVAVMNTTDATASNRMKLYVNGVQLTAFTTATYPTLNLNAFINTVSDHSIGNILFGSRLNQFDGYVEEINFIDGQALTPTSFGAYNSFGVWSPAKYTGSYGTNGFYLPFTNNSLSTLLSTSSNISAPFGGVATNALVADGVYCTSNTSTGSSFTFILNDFGSATQVTRYTIVNLSFTGGVSTFSVQGSPDNSTWTTFASLSVTASNQSFSGSVNGNFRYWRLAPTAFGTNGQASVDQCVFYQDGLGLDFSGNGNNWTPNNISVTAGVTYDSMLDVPTNTSATNANFCVINPINQSGQTITNGNLTAQWSLTAAGHRSTFAMDSGKWYWEVTMTSIGNQTSTGIIRTDSSLTADFAVVGCNAISYYSLTGGKLVNGTLTAYGATYATGDIIGVAVDVTNNTITFYKNGTSQGAITGLSLFGFSWYVASCNSNNQANQIANYNFGQRPFTYTPPTGYVALNTFNLPTPSIPNGAAQFAATLYTGTGAALSVSNAVNSVSFQPDFVWLKGRSVAYNNYLYDSVRGALKELYSDSTSAEVTATQTMTSFNSGGFSVGTNTGVNQSAATFVAWQWKANGTPAVTNTSGSIPSTISANTTSGFSIVTWTGNGSTGTLGHGLGVAPKFIITKYRNAVNAWLCYHVSLGAGSRIYLNQTDASGASTTVWNNTSPTSSVFSVGDANTNASGGTYVGYCFAEIAGFSKFGSYTGNGSADGPFVYLGFRPRLVMTKRTNAASQWYILDTARDLYNCTANLLFPNTTAAESSNTQNYDELSNGFKLRSTNTDNNASGGTYIYIAFAENPFNYSLAR